MEQLCDCMILILPVTILKMTFGIENDIIRKMLHHVIETKINTKVKGIDMGESKRNILDCETGFNIVVNLYIIKYLYDNLKLDKLFYCDNGRKENFHIFISEINRQRFYRMQQAENFELTKEERERIEVKFNIYEEYFAKNGKIIEIEGLDKADWKMFFHQCNPDFIIEDYVTQKQVVEAYKKVDKLLKQLVSKDYIPKTYPVDTVIYKIYYYFHYHVTFKEKSRLTHFMESIDKLRISDWKEIENDPVQLEHYKNLLHKHYEYIWAFSKCKELEKIDLKK